MVSEAGAVDMKAEQLFDVRGRTAIVTGGASGIGLGYAETLARNGARVTLLDIDPARIETEVSTTSPTRTRSRPRANKAAIEGGIGPEHVANLMLEVYNLPQRALVQEICITPTRQRY